MTPPAKTGKGWEWWVTTGILILGLIVGGAWKLKDELAKIDKHIARVEVAVRIVGAKQGGDTKTLIDEALAVARNSSDAGRTESAKRVLDIANHLLDEQKASREPAPKEFFDSTIRKYQHLKKSPELSDAVWDGTTKLAEYRSATTSVPAGMSVRIGKLEPRGKFQYLKDSFISGPNAMVTAGENGLVLDGYWLDNVVFENTTLIYRGGPVILQNVRFVNCTFDVRRSPQAEQLLAAAIKQPVNATIG